MDQDTVEKQKHAEVWDQMDALREQAIKEGMVLMDWDEINAEVQNRRGGVIDDENSDLR
ncbi:MAG: hypothetical protein H7833_18255 [Magnetococcus sp. DMHC-1]